MNDNLLLDDSFASTLVNSLPCGLIVVDRNGRVRALNNISERVLMISKQTVIGKGTGNVRELINTVKFALVKRQGNRIKPEHLPPILLPYMANYLAIRQRESKLKTESVFEALAKTGGNKVRAAETLGVSRSTLYRFFAKQGIDS